MCTIRGGNPAGELKRQRKELNQDVVSDEVHSLIPWVTLQCKNLSYLMARQQDFVPPQWLVIESGHVLPDSLALAGVAVPIPKGMSPGKDATTVNNKPTSAEDTRTKPKQ